MFAILYHTKIKALLLDPFHPLRAGEHLRSEHSCLGLSGSSPLGPLLGQAPRTMANDVPINIIRLLSLSTLQLLREESFCLGAPEGRDDDGTASCMPAIY